MSPASQQEQPRIAIFGATGNIGRPAVEEFLKRKVPLRIVTREKSKAKNLFSQLQNYELLDIVECKNFADVNSARATLKGIESLAINPPTVEDRAKIACSLVEAAKLEGVKHVVLISVPFADMRQVTFQRQFADMEECLKKSNMYYTILRSMFFMENFLQHISSVKSNGKLIQPLHQASFCPISVKDIGLCEAQVLMNSKDHINKTYALTGPEPYTGVDLARTLGQFLGRDVCYEDISSDQWRQELQKAGMEQWMINGIVELMDLFSNNAVKTPSQDFNRITNRSATTFGQMLKMHPEVKT